MGKRAVIVAKDVTKENADKNIGIYLHWNGGEESVEYFMNKAKERRIRGVLTDPSYGWARLCQIIGDFFSEGGNHECSLGVGIVSHLDCHNYDNGVYYIDDKFEIVKHTDGSEFDDETDDEE